MLDVMNWLLTSDGKRYGARRCAVKLLSTVHSWTEEVFD